MSFIPFSVKTAIISLNSINKLIFLLRLLIICIYLFIYILFNNAFQ
jgi:hypothetical protein